MNAERVGIYVRVSTAEQAKGLDSQKRAIQTYLRGHGIAKAKWYIDTISGDTSKRPKLDLLQRDIFNGQIKTVIVWALDRLTRRGPRDGLELLSRWMKSGVRVVSVTEQLDLGTDAGEMIASLLFSIAKMYRTKLIENTKRGLEAAKARGVKLGKRPGKWTAEVRGLHDSGMSPADIARKFGKSRQAVHNVLKGTTATYVLAKS